MEEGNFDTAEIYEHLAFSHKAKSRLKNSLDMEKVLSGQSVTFEVDVDNVSAELAVDDEDLIGLDTDAYNASYYAKKTRAALAKHISAVESELARMDFLSTTFDDIGKSMISIYDKDLVKKEVVRPGVTGKNVPDNGKVFVHYAVVCEGADEPCDSTLVRGIPSVIDMRKPDILPGLFLAIKSMELNEVAKFIVKAPLAFGKQGCPPRIPPNADILYIVEVLQLIDEKMLQSPIYMTAEERALLPFQEIYKTAENLRTEGNGHFKNESYGYAIKNYRKGAVMLEDYPLAGAKDEATRNELLHTLYANLAQCYLNLEKPEKACTMCKLGMKSARGKENVKLLYRFAKAKFMLKDYESAMNLCDKALKVEPSNSDVRSLRQRAETENNKSSAAANKMFQGIFK